MSVRAWCSSVASQGKGPGLQARDAAGFVAPTTFEFSKPTKLGNNGRIATADTKDSIEMKTNSPLLAMSLIGALGLAAAAHAQTPPPPPGAMGGMGDHGMGDQNRGDRGMMEHHRMHEAARLKAFHDALNIRPDQEAAFSALAESMKPEGQGDVHGPADKMRDHQAMAEMTTPERLDAMAREMDEHMGRMREAFQRHATAVKTLYGQLSSEQRKTFDALPSLMGHHGMGRRPEMGPGMSAGRSGEGE
jgi:hypothetical protein